MNHSLNELIIRFLNELRDVESSSNHTLKAYKKDLEQAFTDQSIMVLNSDQMLSLSRQALSKWGSLSPASKNRKSATIKSFLNFLFEKKIIDRPLATLIPSTKVSKKIPNYISVDESIAVLKSLESTSEKLLFLLLYGSGLRVSEACELSWNQVNLKTKSLRIRGKGNKERIVIMPQILCALLNTLRLSNKEDDSIWGLKPLSTRKAFDIIRNAGRKAGLTKEIHPHALRHSFATHLLSSGADLRALQELLGHSSLTATEKYTHLNLQQLANTMEKHHPLKKLSSK